MKHVNIKESLHIILKKKSLSPIYYVFPIIGAIGSCFPVNAGIYLIWQDKVNGYLAMKRLPENLRSGKWLFREDGYFSDTEAGESDYSYESIFMMVESQGYMILVFHDGKAHIIDMSTIQGGNDGDFRRLLRKKTSLTIQTL